MEMVRIPGGTFLMGSEDFYPEERPVRRVEVEGFWMDERAVTAAEFRRFVRETGYVTVAERPLDPADYPDADPDLLVPGSLVFRRATGPVDLSDARNWWEYVPGALEPTETAHPPRVMAVHPGPYEHWPPHPARAGPTSRRRRPSCPRRAEAQIRCRATNSRSRIEHKSG